VLKIAHDRGREQILFARGSQSDLCWCAHRHAVTFDHFVGWHEAVQHRVGVILDRRMRVAVPIPGVSHQSCVPRGGNAQPGRDEASRPYGRLPVFWRTRGERLAARRS
jgi:hypothetical protein